MRKVELVDTGLRSDFAKEAREHAVVLTDKGQPVLALVPLSADTDLENLFVTTHPKFQGVMERSQARYDAEGGLGAEEVRRYVAARRKAKRQSPRRRSGRKAR